MDAGSSTARASRLRDASAVGSNATYDLFLSFSSEHEALVDLFRDHVRGRLSLLSFNDSSMPLRAAEAWQYNAERLIRSCRATLCLVGDTTYMSEPVNWEIRKSVDLGKRVLAVYLQPTASLPVALSEIGVTPLPWDVDAIMDEFNDR